MAEHTIKLETPAPPAVDFQPVISELRERLTRVETLLESAGESPAATESLRLASEAHSLATRALERAEHAAESVPELVENASQQAAEVVDVQPPPAPELPPVTEPEPEQSSESHAHHPWWHPMRYL